MSGSGIEERLKEIEGAIKILYEHSIGVNAVNDKILGIIQEVRTKLASIESEVTNIKDKVASMDGSSSFRFDKLDDGIDDLKNELSKINRVTGYTDQFKNLNLFSSQGSSNKPSA